MRKQVSSRQATQRPGKTSEIRATLQMFPKSKSTQAPGHTRSELASSLIAVVVVHTAASMPVAILAADRPTLSLSVVRAISTDQAHRVTVHGLCGVRIVLSGGHIRPCNKGVVEIQSAGAVSIIESIMCSYWAQVIPHSHNCNKTKKNYRTHQRRFIWEKFTTGIINY